MFRKTVLVHALSLAFSTAALSVAVMSPAMAQSNASGNVYGKVAPGSATSVVIKSLDTNQTRSVNVDAGGSFTATALPIGRYSVTPMKGATAGAATTVEVLAGQGVEASFAQPGIQTVQVNARRSRIDISSANNGATFTARELAKLPIQQNVDAIIQLAPNTTRADSRYAGGASFAGGGASENAYYINGFPVTNPLTQLGASELPFGAIAQAQILTGGFGAEFGRSVGGVVNITTKSGTNNWEIGASASTEPNSMRARTVDLYYPAKTVAGSPTGSGNPAPTDGQLYRRRADNEQSRTQVGAYLSGPIIQDKVFMFLSAETTRTNTSGTDATNGVRTSATAANTGFWNESARKVDRYFGKLDWNISDNHRVELSVIGDTPQVKTAYSGYTYAAAAPFTGTRDGIVSSRKTESNVADNGAEVQILKYTGNLTDAFTVQALYGQSKAKHINEFEGYNPNLFSVTSSSASQAPTIPAVNYTNRQAIAGNILPDGANDKIQSFRLDLEYKLGDHTIRFGLDNNKLSSLNAGDLTAGGGSWAYLKNNDPMASFDLGGGIISKGPGTVAGNPVAAGGYYVTKNLFTTVTNAYSNQNAQYLEDKWQVTKNLLITPGVRIEGFDNQNGDHVKYLEQKNQIAPRLSAVWDVNGDASTKVSASAGRYHLQIPTHLAVRGAGRSTFTAQAFAYSGVDPTTGAPTGLTQLSLPSSANNEYGQAKEPKTLSAVDLKPTYQDEVTLALEKVVSPNLNFGVKGTYRKLRSTIDDFCDSRPFEKYAADNKIDTSNWGGFGCANFNPGEANSFYVDYSGSTNNGGTAKDLTLVKFSAADLGFPKAERNYVALDFFAEHPLRNGWYGKMTYTWSRSKGNTEGQTLSDVGQTDVAATQTWDYKELMIGANGLLPNDRTHQIKAYGFYEVAPEWTIGGNLLAASGRPKSCVGRFLFDGTTPNYSNGPHYCGGVTVPANVLTPRGTLGNMPWDTRLDMNVVYRPASLGGLSLKADLFNVFNRQTAQNQEERWNNGNQPRSTFGRILSTTTARYARLTAEYIHKF